MFDFHFSFGAQGSFGSGRVSSRIPEHAEGPASDQAPGEGRFLNKYPRIEWTALAWFTRRGPTPCRVGRYMATYRSPAVLVSADGTRASGTAALFTEPGRKGAMAPWAGDFRLAADSPRIKNPVGKTLTLEMPDGQCGKVVVQKVKGGSKNTVLALLGEDLAPF